MRILVTGSQGTLGVKLMEELRRRGHEVWGCDLHHAEKDEIRADVSEWRQIERVFKQVIPEVCYHLAAEFGRNNGQEYYEQLWKSNCIGLRNVIELCLSYDVHLVFASSSEAYGNVADRGILYESALNTIVPAFHNEYALTKWTNEQQIKIAIKNAGLKATILRFFNVYGPGEFYSDYRSVVCLFIYRLLKGLPVTIYSGSHRSFLYVDDWSYAVANVVERMNLNKSDGIYNLGSSEYVDLQTLFNIILEEVGHSTSKITVIEKEIGNIVDKMPYTGAAAAQLGMRQDTDLRSGIKKTVEWMKTIYG